MLTISYKLKANSSGFITLISVLIVGAIGVAIATSLLILGLGGSRSSFALVQSNQAKSLANACAEEALEKLRESVYYTGNATINFSIGSCQIQTIGGTGNTNRTLQTVGTVGTIQRKIKIVISSIHPVPVLTSWQELADF